MRIALRITGHEHFVHLRALIFQRCRVTITRLLSFVKLNAILYLNIKGKPMIILGLSVFLHQISAGMNIDVIFVIDPSDFVKSET